MSELWLPGGSSADDFVTRVHQQIARFQERHGVAQATVELELRDGARYELDELLPEPGYGFVTILPHAEEAGEPEELIVPLASVARIRLASADGDAGRFGFTLPELPPGT
jgi:hypothetical protein